MLCLYKHSSLRVCCLTLFIVEHLLLYIYHILINLRVFAKQPALSIKSVFYMFLTFLF
jgi:hypothetical protein